MKYWVQKIINGELQLGDGAITEHSTIESAKTKFHQVCASMWNAPTVITGYVVIIDQQFTVVESEFISHTAQSTPEPTEE